MTDTSLLASLTAISFDQLERGDSKTLLELESAAKQQGFFYLDLSGNKAETTSPSTLLASVEECFRVSKKLYSLPVEERLEYDIDTIGPHKLNGYKPQGRNEGVTEGKRDGFEAYLVSRDEICNTLDDKALPLPSALLENKDRLKRFMDESHKVGQIIVARLSSVLGLPPDHTLQHSHRPERPSTSSIGMLKYSAIHADKAELGHGAHTDVGTITLLFCTDRGLQILEPASNKWKFVEPRASCAIVNIGDSAQFMVGPHLKSCLHRVVPYPDTEIVDRYSLAYFMRPELDAVLQTADGKSWKSVDWHDRKYSIFRAPIAVQKKSSVLTGTAGYVGLWEGA